ncbi:hypothetical protein Q0Z83_035780 [Actinoplanes sichuanensis]|uniref:DUF3885 domain-containing protein n=1 Tax=Actinoplanes sichuanensis TaxID=512349 RepID=A0ABW4ABV4_9ACTN|nr:hypothetical protein [Actinoplanes sichuanensis]BEL05387.1 hypothetical protein Q0Z83_035780 [Actinoplanes sichuanensis]
MDPTELDAAWRAAWSGCPPVAGRLRAWYPGLAVRFHTLPNAQRYATSASERAEILRRHHALLEMVFEDAEPVWDGLIAVTCSWSDSPVPTPRDDAVASTTPDAAYWRSENLATDPDLDSWQHHHISRLPLLGTSLDRLLLCVADDLTDGVLLTSAACASVYHPYDGGMDVFVPTADARDRLTSTFAAWLPPRARP